MRYLPIGDLVAPVAAFIFAVTGHLADAWITAFAIRNCGKREANPLMRPFANSKHPYFWLTFIKLAGLAFIIRICFRQKDHRNLVTFGLGGWFATVWNVSRLLMD